ncbi:uncharacterized protein LOC127289584 isoform X2 [Leptopilina boulardi]|nr:uncharacterized protein LOC127289584 isoform X2 [Leptopilina boulardi]XP_051173546.1 uncharacterized protein LOC127289584 isoform X2 [Leptopilina boulardi]XP_051173547.1 uncharacterized protein LOC127289584 isoform X2 [Leptopilina boulardi]XP_051173548.1 uncharacterized protein LOC127289584 isoform X2 [Leptopilina boulardi]XP_051173549.1 uncharacterized protein LOC127289584 isoform X2 [Leptopilina boulardi]XP_051173550.1 uncharacterized protein LOC127289584 isoform X2 [Leptopilina boulardi]
MPLRLPVILFLTMTPINSVPLTGGIYDGCGIRLERALDALHRESIRRNRLDDDDSSVAYHQQLQTAPLEMTVSRVAVKLPLDANTRGGPWAQVEKCSYEPNDNSIQTRVLFNDLSVSGLVSLVPRDYRAHFPSESCRMTLRLRRAGIEFYTSPIARGRGTMRIRTESSFMEPRFASIYAYGCRPNARIEKQIKRQDKWPPHHRPDDELKVIPISPQMNYEAAEPRELVGVANEEDVAIVNESRQSRELYAPDARLGIWRKSNWITRSDNRKRRSLENFAHNLKLPNSKINNTGIRNDTKTQRRIRPFQIVGKNRKYEKFRNQSKNLSHINETKITTERINPKDFAAALAKWVARNSSITIGNVTLVPKWKLNEEKIITNYSNNEDINIMKNEAPRETREILIDEKLPDDFEGINRDWQSRENVAREMEDVFLKGASQALTQYIERQLHPAIKETLMLSMGYTISYG